LLTAWLAPVSDDLKTVQLIKNRKQKPSPVLERVSAFCAPDGLQAVFFF